MKIKTKSYTRTEIFNKLMKKSKKDIADICAGVINGCTYSMDEENEYDGYRQGWADARKTIYEIWIKPYVNI